MKEKLFVVFDRALEYSMYGLVFFIPISKSATEAFAAFMLLFFILKKYIKPDFSFLKNRANIFLLLFIVFCLLSMFNSGPYLAKSLKAFFLKWMKYIGMFWFIQDAARDRKRIRNAGMILLSVAGLVALDSLFQRFSGKDIFRARELVNVGNGIPAITGPFNHYNDLASYLIVVLILALALLISGALRKGLQSALLPLSILLAGCLFLTFSRGSWIGFVFALALMLFLSRDYRKLIPLLALSLLFLFFLPGVKERFAFTFQGEGDADRLLAWGAASRMIMENPYLGKGIGTFMDYFHAYVPSRYVQYAHNCYLQIWAETGTFSIWSFIIFVGIILYKASFVFRRLKDYLLLGFLCALFAFLVHSFFDTQLYSLQLAFLFWSLLGLTAALTGIKPSVSK